MDIELQLNELIFQYNIDKHIPKYRLYVKAKSIAKDLVREISEKYKKIILVGSKKSDIKWFKSSICESEVVGFCIKTKEEIEISEEYLNNESCFLNVSFNERAWIKNYLLKSQALVVDLYEVFEKNEIFFLDDFYDVYQSEYYNYGTGTRDFDSFLFDMSRIFFQHRRAYEEEKNNENKRKKLEVLIFDLVYAKDFLLLKEYIDIYVKQYESRFSKEYIEFYHAVEKLLQNIKMNLQSRKQKDCVMIWLDYMGYELAETMTFLDEIQEDSISFEKIFTVTPYTRATFKTLFAKCRTVEEDAYKHSLLEIKKNDYKLIKDLEKRNYKFQYYGFMDIIEEFKPLHYYTDYSTMTELYWDMIRDILLSEQQFFCLLHELIETHPPFLSMGIKGEEYSFLYSVGEQKPWTGRESQVTESRVHVDKQLKFWSEILPEHMYKIYMNDHGHTFLGRFRVFMKIQQKDIKPTKCEKLVSYYDFDKILLQVLDEQCIKEEEISKEYAVIQDVDFYNKECILNVIKRKDFSFDDWIGYQGVVTENDMLLHFKHGVEYYQKFVNDEKMVSDQRLEQLRNKISKKEINIETEEKFRYSRIVWNAYQRCKERTKETEEKKLKIIKNIFYQIPSESVLAIRGGGMYTLRLLMLLEEASRRKVCYIVDEDKECPAGKMGIKVIGQEEMKNHSIDYVLLSSYQYKDMWKEEMITFPNIKVIDMYDVLEENGVYCNRDFYHLSHVQEDFGARTKKREDNIIRVINDIFKKIPPSAIVAIRGGGIHTVQLLSVLKEELREKICYIVDVDERCPVKKMGIKVISQDEMKDYHLDYILLSSYRYKDLWKEEMKSFPNIKLIDMYDILEENGIYCDTEFFKLDYEKEDFEG